MKKPQQIKFKQDITVLGSLNLNKTALLATLNKQSSQKQIPQYIVKVIHFDNQLPGYRKMQDSQINQYRQDFAMILKRLAANNQPIIYKPQYYSFQDRCLYLIQQVQNLSLQNMILYHQLTGQPFPPWFVYNVAVKLFESINRIKNTSTEFYHKNLKPSNIFVALKEKETEMQLQLKLTQFGLFTKYPNKFYQPVNPPNMKSRTNISNVSFLYENELHALAVILVELITLEPIDYIYKKIADKQGLQQIKTKIEKQAKHYKNPKSLVELMMALLQQKDNIKTYIDRFKQSQQQYTTMIKYDEQMVSWDFQRFENSIKQNQFEQLCKKLRTQIENSKMGCYDVIKVAQKYDPDLYFNLYDYEKLQLFMKQFNIYLENKELMQISFFLRNCSGMNYMEIFKRVYEPRQIIQGIIKTHLQHYETRKLFFQEKTEKRQYWRAEDVTKYLTELSVYIDEKDVVKVVQGWAGTQKRSSIKYDEFNRLFKEFGKQTLPGFKNQSRNKSQNNQKHLFDMLCDLKKAMQQDSKSLISFFRTYDTKNKWIVGPQIDKEIKKRIAITEKIFRMATQQMWQLAGIENDNKKILQYVTLLKLIKIYDLSELFQLILVQRINESNKQQFYQRYEKDKKGWNLYSIIDFNQDQVLDFDERELKVIFSDLDRDKSGYISEKQLLYYLTGLKQFDKDFIVDRIKEQIGKWDLFQVFLRFDKNKDLYLDSPGDLVQVFECLQIQIPAQHCEQLFRNGMRNGKFPYLQFLRYFIQCSKLFVKSCTFYIDHFYDGNFQKFYDLGRIKNKKKWNFQSFSHINEELLLGFTYNELGQIWEALNPQKEESLTKAQVAAMFNFGCDSDDENILGVDSVEKSKESEIKKKKNELNETKNMNETKKNKLKSEQREKQKNQLFSSLAQKKLSQVSLCFIRKSRQNCELSLNDLCSCLDELKIKYLRNVVMKNTSKFQTIEENKDMKINFFNLIMFLCQLEEDGKEERKAQCVAIIIRELMKFYDKTTEDVFKKCRKVGIMKLTDYQNFVRDLVKTQIFFDDLEDTWRFWGEPQYMEPQDFDRMLTSNGSEGLMRKKYARNEKNQKSEKYRKDDRNQKSERNENYERNQRNQKNEKYDKYQKNEKKLSKQFSFNGEGGIKENDHIDQLESPQFKRNVRSRKESRDSKNQQLLKQDNKKEKTRRGSQFEQERKKEQGPSYPPRGETKKTVQIKEPEGKGRVEKKNENKQISREKILEKFENKIKAKGSDSLNILFSRTNTVSLNQFCTFIQQNYELEPYECQKLSEVLNSFGKVKLETVKKYIKKIESPQKQKEKFESQKRFSKKDVQKRTSIDNKKNLSRDKNNRQREQLNENLFLEDPRKMRLNVPLIKQHIKILVSSFVKSYDINEMQPFFFEGNTNIDKDTFLQKCNQINSSISKVTYQKIFAFLKPSAGYISSVSFKLTFNFDQQIQVEENYLPEDIEAEIKNIFEKSDKDKSGFIQFNEIQSILSSLGINQTQKEIQNYFQKIDQNFDKKINLKQFKLFIEDNILPYISDFDEDVDHLTSLLKMNDVFKTGFLPITTLGGILDRYGVKLGQKDLQTLNRFIANENGQISIKQFINKLYFPSHQSNPSSLKGVLYKIRWRRKISFKDVQKIFQNISASFIQSYTSQVIKNKFVTPSSFITPILNESRFFYNDFNYKTFMKLEDKNPNLVNVPKNNDLIVELKLIDASGIPIPQNQSVKNLIVNRSVNVVFYDTSNEEAKDCIASIRVQFDPDIEDQWIFDKNNRSLFVKIANFEARKYEKFFLLFEFIVTIIQGPKCIDISCGTASFPVKQLQVDNKVSKKYKMISGVPNKSKDIDKMSISKRKGWRGLIGSSEIESQFQIQILPQSKIQDKIELICALPQKSIVNRKAVHLMWTFRQYFAFKSVDQKRVNPDFQYHFIVKTFLICLDIPDVHQDLYVFWKEKIEPKASTVDISRKIFHHLMLDLNIIIYSKQFQLLPSYPGKSTLSNKTLKSTRKKLIQQVFINIEDWVRDDVKRDYKRKKAYPVDSMPFIVEEQQVSPQVRLISQQLIKMK